MIFIMIKGGYINLQICTKSEFCIDTTSTKIHRFVFAKTYFDIIIG